MSVLPPIQQQSGTEEMVVSAELPHLSPEATFAYFTSPELITQWWPEAAEIEAHAGGQYRLLWPKMNWELKGRFEEYEPGRRLSYTWQWIHQPELPARVVTIDIKPLASGTSLKVTQQVYGTSAVEQDDRQGHIDGWIYFLGRLQVLEPAKS